MNRVVALGDWFWVRGPRWLLARAPSTNGVAGDGHVVTTLPLVAVVLPLVSVLLPFAAGAFRLGYTDVYTESVVLVMGLVALGSFSSQLGVLAVVAFSLGDVLSTRPVAAYGPVPSNDLYFSGVLAEGPLAHLVHVRLPDLITYLLLATVVVVLPRAARAVVAGVGRDRPMPPVLAWTLVSGLLLVIVWLGVDAWVAAAPTLVRPVFTWGAPSGVPTVEAVATLQEQGDLVVAAAVAAVVLRQAWLGAAMLPGQVQQRLREAEAHPPPVLPDRIARRTERRGAPRAGRTSPVRAWGGALASATFATLALAGILERAWLWPLTFAVFAAVRLLRSDQVRAGWLDRWRRIAAVLPAWARLLAVWLLSRVAAQSVGNDLIGSYTALTFVVLVSVVVVLAVFPGALPRPDADAATDRDPPDDDTPQRTSAPSPGGPDEPSRAPR